MTIQNKNQTDFLEKQSIDLVTRNGIFSFDTQSGKTAKVDFLKNCIQAIFHLNLDPALRSNAFQSIFVSNLAQQNTTFLFKASLPSATHDQHQQKGEAR